MLAFCLRTLLVPTRTTLLCRACSSAFRSFSAFCSCRCPTHRNSTSNGIEIKYVAIIAKAAYRQTSAFCLTSAFLLLLKEAEQALRYYKGVDGSSLKENEALSMEFAKTKLSIEQSRSGGSLSFNDFCKCSFSADSAPPSPPIANNMLFLLPLFGLYAHNIQLIATQSAGCQSALCWPSYQC